MKSSIKILAAILLLSGILTITDKFSKENIAFGYGYNHTTPPEITVQKIETTDRNPAIKGSYSQGSISNIDVTIYNPDGVSVWHGNPTTITNKNVVSSSWQPWEIADNTIPELPVGVYEITATVTDSANLVATDKTKNELVIQNDFSKLSISFKDDDTSDKRARLRLEDYGDATHYKISTNSRFNGESWQKIDDAFYVNLKDGPKKYKFYVKLKDASGSESDTVSSSVNYKPFRYVSTSPSKVTKGGSIIQRGRRFSKNSSVLLYFSKAANSYYPPVKVDTDAKGSFNLSYIANKPAGIYTWYAIDEKTGKKSNISKYTIRQ